MVDTTLQIQGLAWVILWLSALFGLGVLLRWMKVMEDAAIDHINAFVFNCCLPAAVFKAIASTNLSKLNWIFIVAFLILRVLCKYPSKYYIYIFYIRIYSKVSRSSIILSWCVSKKIQNWIHSHKHALLSLTMNHLVYPIYLLPNWS